MKFMRGEDGNQTFTMSLRDKYPFRPLVMVKIDLRLLLLYSIKKTNW